MEGTAALLRAWPGTSDPQQAHLRARFLHVLADGIGLTRAVPEHLTASCLIVDGDASAVLLVHHAKGNFWVQPGGHVELTDRDLTSAALREAREETGLDLDLDQLSPLDLHRHALSASFGSCQVHDDVMFVARTAGRPAPRCSPESREVAWFDIDALPAGIVPDLPARLGAYTSGLDASP